MANAESNRALPVLLWIAALALAAGVIFAVRSLTHDAVLVRVAPVTYQTLSSTASTNGKVETVDDFQAHAPFPGTVEHIFVEVGQTVQPGTLLVAMDATEARAHLATAQAAVATAEQTLEQIRRGGTAEDLTGFQNTLRAAEADRRVAMQTLGTLQKLQAQGAASAAEVAAEQQKVDAANVSVQNAQSHSTGRYAPIDITAAEAHLNDARAAVASARDELAKAVQRSPVSGTVYSIPISEYDYVPAGEDLLNVAQLKHLQVRAYFDEPEIGKLAEGQSVKIVWDAKPNMTWHGRVVQRPTTVIAYGTTRNVGECIISVDDAHADLLPNTNVTVTVTESERKDVLSIPREALYTEGTASYVYRIVGGKLARTPVRVGIVNRTDVEIISGLKARDVIVQAPLESGQELADGLEVKTVK